MPGKNQSIESEYNFNEFKKISTDQIKVDGYTAFIKSGDRSFSLLVRKDNVNYSLGISRWDYYALPDRTEEMSKIFKQIISSIKFID